MGIVGQLKDLSKEYMKDPQGQWTRHYISIMKIGKDQGVSYDKMLLELKKFWGKP